MKVLGTKPISMNTNECYLHRRIVAIKCARKKTNAIGVPYKMLKRLAGIIGAFETQSEVYELYEIDPALFQKNMRPTRSKGPSAGRVGLARKSLFMDKGENLGQVKLTKR
jgi:hypothetical protein